jgi:hypothetical protein
MATWFQMWVCGRTLAGIVGSNPAGGMDVSLSLVSVVCCQVEVCALGWSLVQSSRTECVFHCDREASTLRRPWPTRGCSAVGGGESLASRRHRTLLQLFEPPSFFNFVCFFVCMWNALSLFNTQSFNYLFSFYVYGLVADLKERCLHTGWEPLI